MLTNMKLSGFKPFKEPQEVPIAPITLIYGPNSAGKSSIIQSLLLLKQSLLTSHNDTDTPVFRGEYVDLGSFKSAVHAHDLNRDIEISVGFKPEGQRFSRPFIGAMGLIGRNSNVQVDLKFRAAKGLDTKVRTKTSSELYELVCQYPVFPTSMDYLLGQTLRLSFQRTSAKQRDLRRGTRRFDSDQSYVCSDQETIGNLLRIFLIRQAYGVGARIRSDRGVEGYQINRIALGLGITADNRGSEDLAVRILHRLNDLVEGFSENFFKAFSENHEIESRCLLPIFGSIVREERSEFIDDEIFSILSEIDKRIEKGSRARLPFGSPRLLFEPIDQINYGLTAALDSLSYLGPLRQPPSRHYTVSGGSTVTVGKSGQHTSMLVYHGADTIEKEINKWFAEFEIPYSLRRKTHGDEIVGQLLSLNLRERKSGIEVGPADVGFGIGQLLPIIVEGVASRSRTVAVEQPEIHLHPRLQGSLADFFIETSRVRQNNRSNMEKQWIIETHSESLMLRMQRRIREQKISKDDVSVLYVAPSSEGVSEVLQLRLNDSGEFIDEWPQGFFEERYEEVFGIDL